MLILGAGLAGCMAGVLNQEAVIYEAAGDLTNHQAVLRFRSPDVGEAVGIPFKEVLVYKDIYYQGAFVAPDIRLMNYYSAKVTNGSYLDRSISDIQTATRWIAPEGFHDMLKKLCQGRIYYNTPGTKEVVATHERVISTIPIHILGHMYGVSFSSVNPARSIWVSKLRVQDADLQQTIYFPDPDLAVYRATMTGDVMRIESVDVITNSDEDHVCEAFGIEPQFLKHGSEYFFRNKEQKQGKLVPMHEQERRNFIRHMSQKYGVYALGRFATWRNILLDDVLNDINQIRKMMTRDEYDFAKDPI